MNYHIRIGFILWIMSSCCPQVLKTTPIPFITHSGLKQQSASFSFFPTDSWDSVQFFKNRALSLRPNLVKNGIKKEIQFTLGFGFADSISLFVNGQLLQSGFFISDYPGTGYYARLKYQTRFFNKQKRDSVRLTVIQHWRKVMLDTMITTHYSKIGIGDDRDSWLLGFH